MLWCLGKYTFNWKCKQEGKKWCRTEEKNWEEKGVEQREREREKKGFGSAYLLHRKESLTN